MSQISHWVLIFIILATAITQTEEKKVSEYTDADKMHHYMGIEMNIQTWNLLGNDDRNEQDDVRMIHFAKASLYHWLKSPKFEPVNEQRGYWMMSRVYAVLGKGKEALQYADETMRLTTEHEFKDFDLAYAYESKARAYAALGNNPDCIHWYQKAVDAGKEIKGVEDKKYFDGDLLSEPWFSCKP